MFISLKFKCFRQMENTNVIIDECGVNCQFTKEKSIMILLASNFKTHLNLKQFIKLKF